MACQPEFSCDVAGSTCTSSRSPEGPLLAYTVTIRNTGDITAQLIARHWVVVDADGHREDVRGLAVVGHQPLLAPGEQFEYTSWTRISTQHGQMHGTYYCMTERADAFEAAVPEFQLVYPGALH